MAYLSCKCGFAKENIPDAHIGKSTKCPKCKQPVLIEESNTTKPPIEQAITNARPNEAQQTTTPRKINIKYFIGIGSVVLILFLFFVMGGDKLLNFNKAEPSEKLLNSTFLYDKIINKFAATWKIDDVRNIFKLSNTELAAILDKYTVRDFVYTGLNKEVEVEWKQIDKDSWRIFFHFPNATKSMVFNGIGGNKDHYEYVVIDNMEADRLPVSETDYYDFINGRIINYFKEMPPKKTSPSLKTSTSTIEKTSSSPKTKVVTVNSVDVVLNKCHEGEIWGTIAEDPAFGITIVEETQFQHYIICSEEQYNELYNHLDVFLILKGDICYSPNLPYKGQVIDIRSGEIKYPG